jgi:hypothetical protein
VHLIHLLYTASLIIRTLPIRTAVAILYGVRSATVSLAVHLRLICMLERKRSRYCHHPRLEGGEFSVGHVAEPFSDRIGRKIRSRDWPPNSVQPTRRADSSNSQPHRPNKDGRANGQSFETSGHDDIRRRRCRPAVAQRRCAKSAPGRTGGANDTWKLPNREVMNAGTVTVIREIQRLCWTAITTV